MICKKSTFHYFFLLSTILIDSWSNKIYSLKSIQVTEIHSFSSIKKVQFLFVKFFKILFG